MGLSGVGEGLSLEDLSRGAGGPILGLSRGIRGTMLGLSRGIRGLIVGLTRLDTLKVFHVPPKILVY